MKTIPSSDLYWRVIKIHHVSKEYVKVKIIFFYKSNDEVCYWLNPQGKAKGFKINRDNFNTWGYYE